MLVCWLVKAAAAVLSVCGLARKLDLYGVPIGFKMLGVLGCLEVVYTKSCGE